VKSVEVVVVVVVVVQNSRGKNPHFGGGGFGGKIKLLSTHNLLCQQFAAVWQKIATSSPKFLQPTTLLAVAFFVQCKS